MEVLGEKILKVLIMRKKIVFLILLFCIYEVMDTHSTCSNHFRIYVSQIIMLYILNLYSAIVSYMSIKLEGFPW